jgi:tetratricopeptide (TPR) repeat protein
MQKINTIRTGSIISLVLLAVLCACSTADESWGDMDGSVYQSKDPDSEGLNMGARKYTSWLCEKSTRLSINGSYEAALSVINKAIVVEPNNWYLWERKGCTLSCLNRTADEAQCFQHGLDVTNRSLEAKPNDAYLWYGKGSIFDSMGRYKEAVRAWDNATELDPNLETAWFQKGFRLLTRDFEDYEASNKALDKVLELSSSRSSVLSSYLAMVWYEKAYSLKKLGRIAESDQALAKAKELGYQGPLFGGLSV